MVLKPSSPRESLAPPAKRRRELQKPMMFVFRKHRPPWFKGARLIFFGKNRWILHDQAQWVDSLRSIDLEPGLQYEEIPWCHWWMHNHFFVYEFSHQFPNNSFFLFRFILRPRNNRVPAVGSFTFIQKATGERNPQTSPDQKTAVNAGGKRSCRVIPKS